MEMVLDLRSKFLVLDDFIRTDLDGKLADRYFHSPRATYHARCGPIDHVSELFEWIDASFAIGSYHPDAVLYLTNQERQSCPVSTLLRRSIPATYEL